MSGIKAFNLDAVDVNTGIFVNGLSVQEMTGSGAYCRVYKAAGDGGVKAFRIYSGPVATDAPIWTLTRARIEAEILQSLNHPHILQQRDWDLSTTTPSSFSDYVPLTLAGIVEQKQSPLYKGTKVDATVALRFIDELFGVVAYLHKNCVAHGDLNPENMLVNSEGHVMLTDFNRAIASQVRGSENNTAIDLVINDLNARAYLAPEQIARMGRIADYHSDVFQLGRVAHALLTGAVPEGLFMPASKSSSGIYSGIDDLLEQAMEKEPKNRFANAGELHVAFSKLRKSASTSHGFWGRLGALFARDPAKAYRANASGTIVYLALDNTIHRVDAKRAGIDAGEIVRIVDNKGPCVDLYTSRDGRKMFIFEQLPDTPAVGNCVRVRKVNYIRGINPIEDLGNIVAEKPIGFLHEDASLGFKESLGTFYILGDEDEGFTFSPTAKNPVKTKRKWSISVPEPVKKSSCGKYELVEENSGSGKEIFVVSPSDPKLKIKVGTGHHSSWIVPFES